jgi:hypothetical protein
MLIKNAFIKVYKKNQKSLTCIIKKDQNDDNKTPSIMLIVTTDFDPSSFEDNGVYRSDIRLYTTEDYTVMAHAINPTFLKVDNSHKTKQKSTTKPPMQQQHPNNQPQPQQPTQPQLPEYSDEVPF